MESSSDPKQQQGPLSAECPGSPGALQEVSIGEPSPDFRRPLNSPASATCTLTSVSSVVPPCQHDSAHGETLELLKDRIKKRASDAVKAFRMFQLQEGPPGRILQSHFRSVLDTLCFPLTDAHFRAVLRHCVRSPPGTVDYRHFLDHFVAVPTADEPSTDEEDPGDVRCTLEEAETKIRERALHRVKPLCLAFRTLDHNQDGLVLRDELRKVIDNFCQLKFGEDVYQRLWSRYDPKDTGLVDYQEFLKKLAVNVSQYQRCRPNLNMKIALTWPDVNAEQHEAHKRRLAILTRSDDPCLRGLTLDNIQAKLKEKIGQQRPLLKRAFLVLDPSGSGSVPSDAFRSVLVHFAYPMSEPLFAQLLRRVGCEPSATVRWAALLDRLGGRPMPVEGPHKPSLARLDPSPNRNRSASATLQLSRIVAKLARVSVIPGLSLRRAFNVRMPDDRHPSITRQELRLIVDKKGSPLSDEEMKRLLVTLDPGHTNLIPYNVFCQLFEESGEQRAKEGLGPKPRSPAGHFHPRDGRLRPIVWEKLVDKLKSKVRSNYETLERAFGSCDYEQKGWIRNDQLRQILHKFCFRVTSEEFERILRLVDAVDGVVSIRRFLDTFCQTERERLQKWSSLVSKLAEPSSPRPWSQRRLQRLFGEVVGARRRSFLEDCQKTDCRGTGSLTAEELRAIVHRQAARLSDAEFEVLWQRLPKNDAGNFHYVKFFEEEDAATSPVVAGSSTATPRSRESPESSADHRPKSRSSFQDARGRRPKPVARPASVHHRSRKDENFDSGCPPLVVRPMTAIAGAAKADFQLCKILARRWREIKRECSAADGRGDGVVTSAQFLGILSKYGVAVSSESLLRLLQTKYGVQLDDRVNYVHFLRDFFLAIGKNTDGRAKVKQRAPTTVCPESEHRLFGVLLELRCQILAKWKSLKKAFRRYDLLGNGCIAVFKFRTALRDNGIHVGDDDFYELAKYLDRDSEGSIKYNDFLRIFMKTVA